MSKPVVEVQVRAVAAASGGCAVFAMATQQRAPIYVSLDVWDEVQDMTEVLRKMQEESSISGRTISRAG